MYLYASAPYEASHVCEFGDWVDDVVTDTHTRTCKVPECGKTETKPHNWDDGVQNGTPTCTEGATVTYTCADCDKIKTETIAKTTEHRWGEWLNNNNNGTHTRYCRCGATETKDCTYNAGVVTTRPTYDATGIMTYTCTACGGTKDEILDVLVKTDEIVSPDNSEIKITVPEGSNAVLYGNTVIKVEEVENEFAEDVKANVQVLVGNDNAEIFVSYDISLILYGVAVQPNGNVEVTLPAFENVDDYNMLQVVFIDDDGNVTPCETRVNADGTITFVTDHFSQYAIIGVRNSSSETTPTEYEILDGASGSWTQNSDGSLSFRGSGAFSDFVGVKVDGILVDAKNYTVKEGSTIVTLNADYLNTLTAGNHTLEIVWTDGSASTAFTVNAKAVVDNDTKSLQTGDKNMMALCIAVLFVSGFGVVAIAVYGKKRKSVK